MTVQKCNNISIGDWIIWSMHQMEYRFKNKKKGGVRTLDAALFISSLKVKKRNNF